MMKKLLRKHYKNYLSALTTKVLEKHKPTVIAVMGDGQISIAREMLYQILHENFPARRNLEYPEAEFSIPFTLLGYTSYPKSYFEHIGILIKTYASLKKIEPHHHFLIIELNATEKEILDHWLNIIKPEAAMIIGNLNTDYTIFGIKKVVKISTNHQYDTLNSIKMGVKQIARFYRLDDNEVEKKLNELNLPESKIRFLPGVNKSLVIDATHYYRPTNINAVFELADTENEKVILFSKQKEDLNYVKEKNIKCIINPNNYEPSPQDTIIIRGTRGKELFKYQNLLNQKMPIL